MVSALEADVAETVYGSCITMEYGKDEAGMAIMPMMDGNFAICHWFYLKETENPEEFLVEIPHRPADGDTKAWWNPLPPLWDGYKSTSTKVSADNLAWGETRMLTREEWGTDGSGIIGSKVRTLGRPLGL